MENGSKAFIISAAVIIAIAVIGLAVYVTGLFDTNGMDGKLDQAKVANHNQKFAKYNTTGITGAQVKECMALAIAHNQNAESEAYTITVTCNGISVGPGSAGFNGAAISNQSVFTGTIATRVEGTIETISFH